LDTKSKLANLKQKISQKNSKNTKQRNSKKSRPSFKFQKQKQLDNYGELKAIVEKVKQVTGLGKKSSDGFIYKLLKNEQERSHSLLKSKKVKKSSSKKKESQRYNPTPIPVSARSKKMKGV
jgi:hypothetical protein